VHSPIPQHGGLALHRGRLRHVLPGHHVSGNLCRRRRAHNRPALHVCVGVRSDTSALSPSPPHSSPAHTCAAKIAGMYAFVLQPASSRVALGISSRCGWWLPQWTSGISLHAGSPAFECRNT
jgi:hypothetical protein